MTCLAPAAVSATQAAYSDTRRARRLCAALVWGWCDRPYTLARGAATAPFR